MLHNQSDGDHVRFKVRTEYVKIGLKSVFSILKQVQERSVVEVPFRPERHRFGPKQ